MDALELSRTPTAAYHSQFDNGYGLDANQNPSGCYSGHLLRQKCFGEERIKGETGGQPPSGGKTASDEPRTSAKDTTWTTHTKQPSKYIDSLNF